MKPRPRTTQQTTAANIALVRNSLNAFNEGDIDACVAAGDQVALRLTFRGTHQGEFLGLPATGRTIEYVSYEFYRIADGRFAEEWICSDTATLQAQLH